MINDIYMILDYFYNNVYHVYRLLQVNYRKINKYVLSQLIHLD